MSIFSERLKELRHKKRLTQQELADKVEVNRVTYTNWERGNREPNIEKLIELSIELNTHMDYLLGKDTITSYKMSFDDFEEFSNKKSKKISIFENRRDKLLDSFKRDYSDLIWDMYSLQDRDIISNSEMSNLYKNTVRTFTDNLCMCGEEYNYFEFEILQRFYNKKYFDKNIKLERSINNKKIDFEDDEL